MTSMYLKEPAIALMRSLNSSKTSRASAPAFKYEKRYTKTANVVKRRDTVTIIRDWLNDQRMTEELSKDRQVSTWSQNGRPMVELRFESEGAIKLTMTDYVHYAAMFFTKLYDLPTDIILKSGRDLYRITPLLLHCQRMSDRQRLIKTDLVQKRLCKCWRTCQLLGQPEPFDSAISLEFAGKSTKVEGEANA